MSANNEPSEIENLEELLSSDPRSVLSTGQQILDSPGTLGTTEASQVYRLMGIAARRVGTIDEAVDLGRRAVEVAQEAHDENARLKSEMTLAGSLYMAGDRERAMTMLEEAARHATGHLWAEIQFQLGAVLARSGNMQRALDVFTAVLPAFQAAEDVESEAMTLQNRGMVSLYAGDLASARNDLESSLNLYQSIGELYGSAGAQHDLGRVAAYEGDLVQAMRLYEAAESKLAGDLGHVAEIQVARCELLLSMGLFRDARLLATNASDQLEALGLEQDRAEALLAAAHACLLDNALSDAQEHATQAERAFSELGEAPWVAHARFVGASALLEQGMIAKDLQQDLRHAADQLADVGHLVASMNARLRAAQASLELDDTTGAVQDLRVVAQNKVGPLEVRLQSFLARARLGELENDRRRALSAARSGMRLLTEHQMAIGATDVRAGIERHSRDLAALGLRLTHESGRTRSLFEWMEAAKSSALRFRPVRPPDDDSQAADLAALRWTSVQLLNATSAEAAELRRRERRLQDSISTRSRSVFGDLAPVATRAVAEGVVQQLGDRVLLEFGEVDGQLMAISVRRGRFRLRELGPASDVSRELRSLRFLLRRAARGRGSDDHIDVVAARLDELLFAGIAFDPGDSMVIVPTPTLYSCPWAVLPTMRDVFVVVAPSGQAWLDSESIISDLDEPSFVAVAGPRLAVASAEVEALGRIYKRGLLIRGPDASASRVMTAMSESTVAHLACHAQFRVDNPMFSALQLDDGDLYVYDLERLASTPQLVALSACDSGFTESGAGEELLGLSSTLLAMGTKHVVASVGLVPDSEATSALMQEMHARIVKGENPALALRAAQTQMSNTREGLTAAAAFVCIGSG